MNLRRLFNFILPSWILIRNPSRTFSIPNQQLEKIQLILTTMQYTVLNQNTDPNEFELIAVRQPSSLDIHPHLLIFDTFSVSFKGSRTSQQHWQIRLVLEIRGIYSEKEMESAHLILEDLMNALGWKIYSEDVAVLPKDNSLVA